MSTDFKEKLKAYAEGRLSEEDKLLIEEELEKLELYQEFLDDQADVNTSKKPDFQANLIKNQEKIIRKSKWKARLLNASITLILFSVLLMSLQALTSRYYKFGKPSKLALYTNVIKAAVQTTRPNADAHGSTFRPGMLFSSEIGVQYSKEVGKEKVGEGNVVLKFHFSKPSVVTDKEPDSSRVNDYYFDPTLYKSESVTMISDSKMWNTLEKLPEGTVTEAYITFNRLYETDEVFDMFRNKDMDLLWLAVDTGVKDDPHAILGFPHKESFPELRRNWYDPPPKFVQHYTGAEFRNQYFIDTLKFLNEYKDIALAVDSKYSVENFQEALNHIDKNGVKILGVTITGPTKEILKLRKDSFVGFIRVGETRLWNWD